MINCHYCKRPCRKVRKANTNTIYWQCDYHGGVVIKYLTAIDNNITNQNWVTIIMVCKWKEETYHVVFILNTEDPIKFRIDKVRPQRYLAVELADAVISLDFLPEDITPENVMTKLPTYLLFS